MDAVVLLLVRGTMLKTEIYNRTSTSPRMADKLESLRGEGLVSMHVRGNSIEVSLTEDGARLARALCALDFAMYGRLTEPLLECGGAALRRAASGTPEALGEFLGGLPWGRARMSQTVGISRTCGCPPRGSPCPRTSRGCRAGRASPRP